jgi:hypothetical protein
MKRIEPRYCKGNNYDRPRFRLLHCTRHVVVIDVVHAIIDKAKIRLLAYLAEVIEAHSSIQELPVSIQHLRTDCPVPQLQLPVLHIVHQRSGLAHVVLCCISLLQGD